MPAPVEPVIPIARPLLGEAERERVLAVLASGRLAAGPEVRSFEEAFADYVGARYAVATSSGTAALLAAVTALGIGAGDRVFVSPLTFAATVNVLLFAGAVPVWVDVDPVTFNLDPRALERAVAEQGGGRAVVVVHLYGLPAAMDGIMAVARAHGLTILEDCCQAPGAAVGGRRVGTFGRAAVFSFYATKNLTTGEGGALVTDDGEVAERARRFINHGQRDRYLHEEPGLNLRMGEIQAALGLAQLARLEERNEARRANARFYDGVIAHPAVRKPAEPPGFRHVYHLYTVRVADRDGFLAHMARRGVECAVHYPRTVAEQPLYRRVPTLGGPCPEAERAAREVVSLPVHPGLTARDLETVAAAVNAFVPGGGRAAETGG